MKKPNSILKGLISGTGFAFKQFIENPVDLFLNQAVGFPQKENDAIPEKSIFYAKLAVRCNTSFSLKLMDILRGLKFDWESFQRRALPFLEFILFRDLLHGKEKKKVFPIYLESRNRVYFLLSLEALSAVSEYRSPLPRWVGEAFGRSLKRWSVGVCEEGSGNDFENPIVVSERAIQALIASIEGDSNPETCSICGDLKRFNDRKEEMRKAFKKGANPLNVKKVLPSCLLSFLPSGIFSNDNFKKLLAIHFKEKHSFIQEPLHLELIGFILGLQEDHDVFDEWLFIKKRWPFIRFPFDVMKGFLYGLPLEKKVGLLEAIDFFQNSYGYILTLQKLTLVEQGVFSAGKLKDLFLMNLKEENPLGVNAILNSIEKHSLPFPFHLFKVGFFEALLLRNRVFCFSRCANSFSSEEIAYCLNDASFKVQEKALEILKNRNLISQIRQLLFKKLQDPFLPNELSRIIPRYLK